MKKWMILCFLSMFASVFADEEEIATTWGKIHYAKDGVHIVPTKPRM
jgi:hypothetical protein